VARCGGRVKQGPVILSRLGIAVSVASLFLVASIAASAGDTSTTTTTTTAGAVVGSTTTTTTTTATTTTTLPATTSGPNGVESSAVIAENRRAGTRSWRISDRASPTALQGYANLTYAKEGQDVTLYVDSHVTTYRAIAYRMGWYQGLGAREVWASPIQSGVVQPSCTLAALTNMVSCANWHPSLVMPVTADFTPGDYLIKLTDGSRAQSYIPLTIWDPSSAATYVVMNRSLVEEAWNTYGGYSFYKGQGPCILDETSYPPCNRARVVSFDRPYDTDFGASDFLTNEYPLIQLMEREGLDVTYISDVTLSQYPGLLLRHKVLLTLDHDEGWTYSERLAVQDAVAHGVNVVYFGAAAMVRHDRLQSSPLGPDREVVDYRDAYEDPLNSGDDPMQVTGNTWESPPADWSPVAQIGEQYSGYLSPGVTAPMVISDASSWVFRGTDLRDGSSLPGVIGSDFDHVISGSPPNVEILAHSPIPSGDATISGGTWDGVSYSDMVYFTDPASAAGVIDTGNNVWIGDLRPCVEEGCPSTTLRKITNNILQLFGQGPAGREQPSVSNAGSVSAFNS
jgi:hypothetical protein